MPFLRYLLYMLLPVIQSSYFKVHRGAFERKEGERLCNAQGLRLAVLSNLEKRREAQVFLHYEEERYWVDGSSLCSWQLQNGQELQLPRLKLQIPHKCLSFNSSHGVFRVEVCSSFVAGVLCEKIPTRQLPRLMRGKTKSKNVTTRPKSNNSQVALNTVLIISVLFNATLLAVLCVKMVQLNHKQRPRKNANRHSDDVERLAGPRPWIDSSVRYHKQQQNLNTEARNSKTWQTGRDINKDTKKISSRNSSTNTSIHSIQAVDECCALNSLSSTGSAICTFSTPPAAATENP